ncbi:hypothetical protein AGMMS50249_6580 [candidate division SR1 bacterium]|nr:hypothetical protein AGMMS50249_6580 [candidate division SR1 bacterium]
MNFNIKLDDKKLKVDIESTNLKDVLIYCKPKERLVLVRKFGLGGEKGIPLQKIGVEYGLTRERIRQIETQALMRLRRLIVGNETYMNVLNETKKILEAHGGVLSEDALTAKLINRNLFKFTKTEFKVILISDFDVIYLKRNKFIEKAFYIEPLYEDILTKISIWTKDYFTQRGESQDIYEFIATLKNQMFQEYKDISYLRNDLFYINLFSIIKDVKVFDGKIGLTSFHDVNPKTMKLKIYYTMKRLNKPTHFQELPAKIMDRFPEKNCKINTIHNELVKNNDLFVNLGLGRYGLKERGYEGGLVKDILVKIFQRNNRSMTIKELCKEVLKEKMVSPNTVMLNLQKYKDLFERVDKGTYQLKK